MKPTLPIQVSFARAEYEKKKKRTRREVFLEKMEQVVPWKSVRDAKYFWRRWNKWCRGHGWLK
jgi:hypothetical protein